MLFGIPRNSPMPTVPSSNVELNPMSLDSPFVDITLNNPEEISIYQINKNMKLAESDLRKPILKKFTAGENLADTNNKNNVNKTIVNVEENLFLSNSKSAETKQELVNTINEFHGLNIATTNSLKQSNLTRGWF